MVSRRQFLAGSGGLAGSGLLSGCSRLRPASSSVALPEAREPTYRDWLPEPEAVGRSSRSVYGVEYFSVPDLLSASNADPRTVEFYLDPLVKTWSFLGLSTGEMDDVTTIEAVDGVEATVVRGAFDAESVATAVGLAGFRALDTYYRGYERYHRPSPDRTLGIADGTVVYARGPDSGELLESVIDARHGRLPRYHEANGDFAVVSAALGERAAARINLREGTASASPGVFAFEGSAASGHSREVADSTPYTRIVVPFLDEGAANVEAVREAMTGDGGGEFDAVEASRDGRVVFVDAKTALDG